MGPEAAEIYEKSAMFFCPGDIVMLFFVFFLKISFQEKLNKITQVTLINIFLLLTRRMQTKMLRATKPKSKYKAGT